MGSSEEDFHNRVRKNIADHDKVVFLSLTINFAANSEECQTS